SPPSLQPVRSPTVTNASPPSPLPLSLPDALPICFHRAVIVEGDADSESFAAFAAERGTCGVVHERRFAPNVEEPFGFAFGAEGRGVVDRSALPPHLVVVPRLPSRGGILDFEGPFL